MAVAFMEMTYIPTLNEDSLFVWLTDEPGAFTSVDTINRLTRAKNRQKFFRFNLRAERVEFEEENGSRKTVTGCLLPLAEMFRFLTSEVALDEQIRPGATFSFWMRMAGSLSVLLEEGHYYPTLLKVRKGDKHFAFSHWMLSRQALSADGLFNEWIRMIPVEALSAFELASIGVRQWLSLLLDIWTDRIVRHTLSTSLPWRKHNGSVSSVAAKWVNDLKQPRNVSFLSTSDFEKAREIESLVSDCRSWHQAMIGTLRPNPVDTLRSFLYKSIGLDQEPISVVLHPMPDDETNAFLAEETWSIRMRIAVRRQTGVEWLNGEDACRRHLTIRQWLQELFGKLAKDEPLFRKWRSQLYDDEYVFRSMTKEWTPVYSRMKSDKVRFELPAGLSVRNHANEKPEVVLQAETKDAADEHRFSLETLVNFDWQVSVGDLSLSMKEFESLIESQQRFMRHRGNWIELPFEKLRAAYEEWSRVDQLLGRKGTLSDLLRMKIADETDDHAYLSIRTGKGADDYLQRLLRPDVRNVGPVPEGFRGSLRPYQEQGFRWLAERNHKGVGVCLADDMGLGKTIQTIAFLLATRDDKMSVPSLIICPTSLIENWRRELNRFAPNLTVYLHHGSKRLKDHEFRRKKRSFEVMITSYNLAARDTHFLHKYEWPHIILDEAQAIKNPATKQSRAIRTLRADHRVALTGTPMENRLEELWSIMDFLNPGYLGSLRAFRQQFVNPRMQKENTNKIRQLVQPFMLRREKSDRSVIRDLPDKIEHKQYCYLSEEQASLYQSIVNDLTEKMQNARGIERKGLILASLTRLKQLCDHPQLILRNQAFVKQSGKLTECFRLLDRLFADQRSPLIFTQYVKMGRLLQEKIKDTYSDRKVYFMHGGLSSDKREALLDNYRNEAENAVFILSLRTGGVGLNLTEASDVIHFDRWWNPAVENQATDRAHRIGQRRNVHVHKLISIGTLEEKIDEMIERKQALTDQVIGAGESWITEMDDEEVMNLIQLRKQVI
ncbi:MAG TPA: DEAD/DEAH box helicase [Bacillales bacterium]|nr:DEAD/DEAH box helicase [Bacillales bacterium]